MLPDTSFQSLLPSWLLLTSSQPPVCRPLEAIMYCGIEVICNPNCIHVIFIYTIENSFPQEPLAAFVLEG